MTSAQTLIDKAAELCGGHNRLAERIGYDRGQLSRIRHGAPMPLPMAGELADVLGADYHDALAACIAEQEPPGRKRAAVARLLRLPAAAAMLVAALFSPENSHANQQVSADGTAPLCVLRKPRWRIVMGRLLRGARRPFTRRGNKA